MAWEPSRWNVLPALLAETAAGQLRLQVSQLKNEGHRDVREEKVF